MGVALWIASGLIAFFVARLIPFGRRERWLAEFLTTLFAAMALGVLATAFQGRRQCSEQLGVSGAGPRVVAHDLDLLVDESLGRRYHPRDR